MNFRLWAATLISTLASVSIASAADIAPVYKAQPVAAAPLWAGFYIGGNAGYAWGQTGITPSLSDVSCLAGVTGCPAVNPSFIQAFDSLAGRSNQSGGVLGGQIGYNFQSNHTIIGFEADLASTKLKSSYSATGLAPISGFPTIQTSVSYSASDSLDYFGTVRGRLGFLISPPLLVFATGGLAYGKLTTEAAFGRLFTNSPGLTYLNPASSVSQMQIGYTLGGGAEYKLTGNWSVKAEYLYFDLPGYTTPIGSHVTYNAFNQAAASGFGSQINSDYKASILRFGINYLFN